MTMMVMTIQQCNWIALKICVKESQIRNSGPQQTMKPLTQEQLDTVHFPIHQWITNSIQHINSVSPSLMVEWLPHFPPGHTTTPCYCTTCPYCTWSCTLISHICHTILWWRCRVECDTTDCYVYYNNNIILHRPRGEKNYGHYLFKLVQQPHRLDRTTVQNCQWPDNPNMTILSRSQQYFKTPTHWTLSPTSCTCQCKKTQSSSIIRAYFHYPHQHRLQPLTIANSLVSQVFQSLLSNNSSLYQQQQWRGKPSNHSRTCCPQLNQSHKENDCRCKHITRVKNQTNSTQFYVGLRLQRPRIKQYTSIWLDYSHIPHMKAANTYFCRWLQL